MQTCSSTQHKVKYLHNIASLSRSVYETFLSPTQGVDDEQETTPLHSREELSKKLR